MNIPKYKRDCFTFISNLGDYTANPNYPDTYLRDGYLLSSHYTNATTQQLAQVVRQRRNLLMSDNGNYTRMKEVARVYEDEGEQLLKQAQQEQAQQGAVSATTLSARTQLIKKIALACQQKVASTDYQAVIDTQLSIRPHYLIGLEDLTIPVLMLCGLMHPVFKPQPQQIKAYQAQTLDYFQQQVDGKFGNQEKLSKVAKFLVLHAYDYASAKQAAEQARNTPKQGVAISYGGPMHSRRWIEHLYLGNQKISFDEKLPEMYLLAQSITLGVVNGHATDIPFHILGVGTPILIALIGYQLRHSRAVSIDSTAPFKDAFVGKLYGSDHAYLKMDMFRVAAYSLVHDQPFQDTSPFFRAFEEKYPANWKKLQTQLHIRPTTNVRELAKELERQPELLQKYIPFFTPISGKLDDTFLMDLRIARSGYNYWVLQKICKAVRRRYQQPDRLKRWIEKEVEKYTQIAHPKWAKTVEQTFLLTEKYRQV